MAQPTQRPPAGRIPRSANAPAQPTIAWDLARTAAVCDATADALDGLRIISSFGIDRGGLSAAETARHVATELSRRSVGALKEVVCDSASAAALSYIAAVIPDVERAEGPESAATLRRVRKLSEWVHAGELRRDLEKVWESVSERSVSSLEALRTSLTANGFDAEALRWAVITFESHSHIRLVWQQAYKLAQSLPDRSAADLLGWGWQGLRVALDKYDPALGYAFSTYACTRINGAIRDGARSENPIPKRLTTYVRKVTRLQEDLTYRLGRVPTLDELAAALGADAESLTMLPRLASAASIDELTDISAERTPPVRSLVDPGADPAEQAVNIAQADAIAVALDTLPDDERQAVELLVYQGLPVAEVKQITGANPRQLRARRDRGLVALAGALADWAPVAS